MLFTTRQEHEGGAGKSASLRRVRLSHRRFFSIRTMNFRQRPWKARENGVNGYTLSEGVRRSRYGYTQLCDRSGGTVQGGRRSRCNSFRPCIGLDPGRYLRSGTEEQKQKYLVPLARGEKIGAFGLTEAECRFRCRRHRDNGRIKGIITC